MVRNSQVERMANDAQQAPQRRVAQWRRPSVATLLRVGMLAAALLAVALALLVRPVAGSAAGAQALVGRQAPAFALPAAQNGHTLPGTQTLAAHRGRAILLVFFNTLCVHCLGEVQTSQSLARSYPQLDIVYIDAPGESAQITTNYLARLNFDPPVLLDAHERVAARYGVAYYPTLILVDARGAVRATWLGEVGVATVNAAISAAVG
ncbi:MAG TPA: TlpA disulfide reductase family protein [Ktedonobacterales bacterium]|nr:TlpA disulfide reductase family protein [Ktedonobacterales bacterium]